MKCSLVALGSVWRKLLRELRQWKAVAMQPATPIKSVNCPTIKLQ